MNFFDWMKPGLNIKRWIFISLVGLALIIVCIGRLIYNGMDNKIYAAAYIAASALGLVLIVISARCGIRSILLIASGNIADEKNKQKALKDLFYKQRFLVRGPRIVAIGGGTGLSTMLRGLKEYTSNITAIVTVADDGGGSGILRETMGILPPGDIRNCLVGLAHTEPVMEDLMQYRFKEGELKGQNFGNLFIAAMNDISSSFEEAIKKMSDVLAVKGKVCPVTLTNVTLCAELENKKVVKGESTIGKASIKEGSPIKRVFLEPDNPKPFEDALFAIDNADCIIIGPGSLYTSILPNLVIKEVAERVKSSKAIKIYVSNIMTQPGETDGYMLSDHINAIERHCGPNMIDFAIANNGNIEKEYYEKYKQDGQDIVGVDRNNISKEISIIQDDFVDIRNGLLRHNHKRLAHVIMKLTLKYGMPGSFNRIIDKYYLAERIKEMKREVE